MGRTSVSCLLFLKKSEIEARLRPIESEQAIKQAPWSRGSGTLPLVESILDPSNCCGMRSGYMNPVVSRVDTRPTSQSRDASQSHQMYLFAHRLWAPLLFSHTSDLCPPPFKVFPPALGHEQCQRSPARKKAQLAKEQGLLHDRTEHYTWPSDGPKRLGAAAHAQKGEESM